MLTFIFINSGFMETSAVLSINIEKTFGLIIRRVRDNRLIKQRALEKERLEREELAAHTAENLGGGRSGYGHASSDSCNSDNRTSTVTESLVSSAINSNPVSIPSEQMTGPLQVSEKRNADAKEIQRETNKRSLPVNSGIGERKQNSGGCCIIL